MNEIRVMFMGTPVFAKEILRHLNAMNLNIVATVSQPDRAVGRKRVMTMTPVHELSSELGIDCIQPENIKHSVEDVLKYNPDIIITCAYGQIVPDEILNFPKYGSFNIHASLLPKLRGGAPIHKAIMYEEENTGITIMEMIKKMDAGNIILKKSIPVLNTHTTNSLELELIEVAKSAIEEAYPLLISDDYPSEVQDEALVTYAYNISKEEEYISFDRSYSTVSAHIRSLIDRPVGYGIVDSEKIKFHSIRESDINYEGENGLIIGSIEGGLGIVIDNKVLIVDEIQPAGKRKMSAVDFMNGAGQNYVNKRFQ